MRVINNPGRAAGLLYLLLSLLGAFSILYVPSKLIVPGDATTTANNILASEGLYRLSIVSGLASAVVFLFLVRALYRLLHPVSRPLASLMVTLVMVSVAIGFALTVNDLAALAVLRGADFLAVFSQAQREALAMFFLHLSSQAMLVSQIFWGLWLFPFGVLVMRSGILPRILGILLIVNGVAYVVASLTGLLLPEYAGAVNRVAFIFELGEVWMMLWLLIRGARVPQVPEAAPGLVAPASP
jgi:uncharacterized protein DUF4386